MWKLTLGYGIGDALILGFILVSKFKKIPIPYIYWYDYLFLFDM
jgi:hypothetical protein